LIDCEEVVNNEKSEVNDNNYDDDDDQNVIFWGDFDEKKVDDFIVEMKFFFQILNRVNAKNMLKKMKMDFKEEYSESSVFFVYNVFQLEEENDVQEEDAVFDEATTVHDKNIDNFIVNDNKTFFIENNIIENNDKIEKIENEISPVKFHVKSKAISKKTKNSTNTKNSKNKKHKKIHENDDACDSNFIENNFEEKKIVGEKIETNVADDHDAIGENKIEKIEIIETQVNELVEEKTDDQTGVKNNNKNELKTTTRSSIGISKRKKFDVDFTDNIVVITNTNASSRLVKNHKKNNDSKNTNKRKIEKINVENNSIVAASAKAKKNKTTSNNNNDVVVNEVEATEEKKTEKKSSSRASTRKTTIKNIDLINTINEDNIDVDVNRNNDNKKKYNSKNNKIYKQDDEIVNKKNKKNAIVANYYDVKLKKKKNLENLLTSLFEKNESFLLEKSSILNFLFFWLKLLQFFKMRLQEIKKWKAEVNVFLTKKILLSTRTIRNNNSNNINENVDKSNSVDDIIAFLMTAKQKNFSCRERFVLFLFFFSFLYKAFLFILLLLSCFYYYLLIKFKTK
jgi:hypothetical protein